MPRPLLAVALAALTLAPAPCPAQPLPGTKPWSSPGDPAGDMVAGIGRFLDRELAASVERRRAKWRRDTSSPEAYARSIEPNRARFLKAIGAVGERVAPVAMAYVSATDSPAKV